MRPIKTASVVVAAHLIVLAFLFQTAGELLHGYLPQHAHCVVGSFLNQMARKEDCDRCRLFVSTVAPASPFSRLGVRSNWYLVAVAAISLLAIRCGGAIQQLAW
jgi:hypothetical protein